MNETDISAEILDEMKKDYLKCQINKKKLESEKNHIYTIDKEKMLEDVKKTDVLDSKKKYPISPQNAINEIPKICSEIRDFWIKNYVIKDIDIIDICMGVAISHAFPDDPVWLCMVAQSSGLKTEIVRSFGDVSDIQIHPTSKITENAVISGAGEGKGDSLVGKINGKIWLIKDLTTLLESRPETVHSVSSHMREVYDGYISVDSGMKGGSKNAKVRCTLIAGVTPDAIDNTKIFRTEMGERMIYKRFPEHSVTDRDKTIEVLFGQRLLSENRRKEINDIMNRLLFCIFALKDYSKYINIKINDDSFRKIFCLAEVIALLRRSVTWNYKGNEIIEIGRPEGPYRLTKQLVKLVLSLKFVKNSELDDEIIKSITRIGLDSIPFKRSVVLEPLFYHYPKLQESLGINNSLITYYANTGCGISKGAARFALEELREFNIIENHNEVHEKWWKFTEKFITEHKEALELMRHAAEYKFSEIKKIFNLNQS